MAPPSPLLSPMLPGYYVPLLNRIRKQSFVVYTTGEYDKSAYRNPAHDRPTSRPPLRDITYECLMREYSYGAGRGEEEEEEEEQGEEPRRVEPNGVEYFVRRRPAQQPQPEEVIIYDFIRPAQRSRSADELPVFGGEEERLIELDLSLSEEEEEELDEDIWEKTDDDEEIHVELEEDEDGSEFVSQEVFCSIRVEGSPIFSSVDCGRPISPTNAISDQMRRIRARAGETARRLMFSSESSEGEEESMSSEDSSTTATASSDGSSDESGESDDSSETRSYSDDSRSWSSQSDSDVSSETESGSTDMYQSAQSNTDAEGDASTRGRRYSEYSDRTTAPSLVTESEDSEEEGAGRRMTVRNIRSSRTLSATDEESQRSSDAASSDEEMSGDEEGYTTETDEEDQTSEDEDEVVEESEEEDEEEESGDEYADNDQLMESEDDDLSVDSPPSYNYSPSSSPRAASPSSPPRGAYSPASLSSSSSSSSPASPSSPSTAERIGASLARHDSSSEGEESDESGEGEEMEGSEQSARVPRRRRRPHLDVSSNEEDEDDDDVEISDDGSSLYSYPGLVSDDEESARVLAEMDDEERPQRTERGAPSSTALLGPCTICHEEDIVEPAMCKQCKNVVGCHACVARWMRTAESPACPLCRERWTEAASQAIPVRLLY